MLNPPDVFSITAKLTSYRVKLLFHQKDLWLHFVDDFCENALIIFTFSIDVYEWLLVALKPLFEFGNPIIK